MIRHKAGEIAAKGKYAKPQVWTSGQLPSEEHTQK
jgi:hypothetical protein